MRVLVVEDEQVMADSLAWGLEADGYTVDIASDGVEGLWKAREGAPDVVILDVMLPRMNGYEVCRRLREADRWTPILMLTALDEDLDQAEGLDGGADDYLTKPFSYPVLLAHLRALLRRPMDAPRPEILRSAELALDPASRSVTRDGVALELTSREVAVLEFLMRHRGRVVSKTELVEHCWDAHYDGPLSVVEVLMHRLRRKIDRALDASMIRTVRGEGYLLP